MSKNYGKQRIIVPIQENKASYTVFQIKIIPTSFRRNTKHSCAGEEMVLKVPAVPEVGGWIHFVSHVFTTRS